MDGDEVGDGRDGTTGAGAEVFAKASSLGSTPMGARVTAQLQHDDRFYGTPPAQQQSARRTRTRLGGRMGLGGFLGGGGEDEDE